MPSFYEFFAGGGMARAGLGDGWQCVFANDIDPKKAASYRINWGVNGVCPELRVEDVAELTTEDEHLSSGRADLAWASFPCQDLSLAGAGAGLSGDRSGTFRPFWSLIESLRREDRAPKLVVLENVVGALTAGKDEEGKKDVGRDFVELGRCLTEGGYRFGALVVDAVHWVPQSRPRLFIIAVDKSMPIVPDLIAEKGVAPWHTSALIAAYSKLAAEVEDAAESWVWWKLPAPPTERVLYQTLEALIEKGEPTGVSWHTPADTERLRKLMNDANKKKLREAEERTKTKETREVGTVYKRMRPEPVLVDGKPLIENGKEVRKNVQRAEVRFDDIAGCLRTPTGGSSRQTILIVERGRVRSRLLSPVEAARLMGLGDDYELPEKYNDAYHLTGDGVAVDVVRFLAANILEPLLKAGLAAAELAPPTILEPLLLTESAAEKLTA